MSGSDDSGSLYLEQYAPPWRPLLALVFPILPIFWTYRVNVTETTITFGYSYARSEYDRADVISAETIEHVNGLTQWGGWGIRHNFNWETGYIAKNGPAVRVRVKKNKDRSNSKTYVFSCDQPAEICSILNGQEEESS